MKSLKRKLITFYISVSYICSIPSLIVTYDPNRSGGSSEVENWFNPKRGKSSREVDENPVADQLADLRDRMEEVLDDLGKIKLSMFMNQNKENIFESRMAKCSKALSESNEISAMKYWEDIQIYLGTYDQAKAIATQVIDGVHLASERATVLSLIHFARYMNVPQAYDIIVSKLKKESYYYGAPEIFVLANDIKNACGSTQSVFKDLPQVLRDVTSSVVNLRNSWTNGYLYYQSTPESFFTWFSPHKHRNYFDQLDESKKPRGQWEFLIYGDKIRVVNSYNGNILLDPKALFDVELVNNEEIRLRVHHASNPDIIGKYLVGKPRNKGEQFAETGFLEESSATSEQLKWKAQPLRPRTMPEKIQRC